MTDSAGLTLGVRSNFATHHLRAAARAARDAHGVEQANANAKFGPWFDEMMRLVPISVVMAGAALEANANELIQDFLDQPTGLSTCRKMLLKDLKGELSGNAIDKYRRLALLFDREPDKGKSEWEDAQLLVRFRNSFMHFKPAWDHEDIHSGTLFKGLKSKVPVVSSWQGKDIFPEVFMTYGCANLHYAAL
jgi:hypothetical protein